MSKRRAFGRIYRRDRSRNYYVRFQYPGKPPIERVAGPNKDIAAMKLARVQVLLADRAPLEQVLHEVFGDPLDSTKSMTLRQAIPLYVDDSAGRRKESTIEGYVRIFEAALQESWAQQDLRALDHRDVKAWIAARHAKGTSGPTLNRSLCALSSLYRWAIREGYAEANPMARIPKYSEKGRARETYLSSEEARALVAASAEEFRPLLVCALATGMRLGELRSLTWGSVDLERRFLTVEPEKTKTSRARTVPISDWLEEHLRRLQAPLGSPEPGAPVFRTPDGEPYTNWQVRKRLDPALLACVTIPEAKKPKVTMHTMRHTAASLMVAAGVPIFDVAKILGHSTIAVTMRYAHFAPAAGRGAIDALDRQLRPAAVPPGVAEGHAHYRVDGNGLRAKMRPGASTSLRTRKGHSEGHRPLAAALRSS